MKFFPTASICVAILGAALTITGCEAPNRSAPAISSLMDTQTQITDARKQVDATIAATNALTQATDLRQPYDNYCTEVSKLEAQADNVKARAKDMNQRAAEYEQKWQQDSEAITSPELRASAESRRAAVNAQYETIRQNAQAAKAAYEPFLKDLKELQSYLKNDMTSAGVQSASSMITKINTDGQNLNAKLDALSGSLNATAAALSPTGSTP